MADPELFVVVMAGGAGTRFWPASTKRRPKQLLALVDERTLLQQSVDRVRPLADPAHILVFTSVDFVDDVRAQLPELPHDNILAEPMRRDTAAAIAWAALVIEARVRSTSRGAANAVMAVLTSDHVITPAATFADDLTRAVALAQTSGALVTFGIPPTFPSTGFGYLELHGGSDRLSRFVEKPDSARAATLVAAGCLWNSGMFVWTVPAILDELTRSLPEHMATLRPAVAGTRALADAFAALARVSIDFGVMEKARDVRCVRARFSWSDVGSFPALAEHLPKDEHGNAARARTATLDARDNVVWAQDADELVALVGVQDLVVVRAGKRTLIAPRHRAEDIKKLVEKLPAEDQE